MAADLSKVQECFFKEAGDTAQWCEDEYQKLFASYFEQIPGLYETVVSNNGKLSDGDLETILCSAPLQLISVSEQLSQYKLNNECLKLQIKRMEAESVISETSGTMSEKRDKASLAVMDYKLLSQAYSAVISRVENQINFTRELVMSAKKIWDSRSRTREAAGISVNPLDNLQDYTYVK